MVAPAELGSAGGVIDRPQGKVALRECGFTCG